MFLRLAVWWKFSISSRTSWSMYTDWEASMSTELFSGRASRIPMMLALLRKDTFSPKLIRKCSLSISRDC